MIRPTALVLVLLLLLGCGQDDSSVVDASPQCRDGATRSALEHKGRMVLVPAGCRNFTWPGHAPESNHEYLCVSPFYMDSVEMTVSDVASLLGPMVASFHPGMPDACPSCPMDNLTFFEAALLANARTKAELNPAETVYTYMSAVVAPTTDDWASPVKPTEITNLVGLIENPSKAGFRLPTRAEFAWAALQDFRDTSGYPNSPDASYQWNQWTAGGTSHPVGTLLPNPFGLYDMIGNSWEWTSDLDTIPFGWDGEARVSRIALGGGVEGRPSAEQDNRFPAFAQDWEHAGVRFVRIAQVSASVLARPCHR